MIDKKTKILSKEIQKPENDIDSASEAIPVNKGDIRAKWDMCKVTFLRYHDIKSHIESTHKVFKVFDCDECNKSFIVKWRLKKHKTTTSNIKL